MDNLKKFIEELKSIIGTEFDFSIEINYLEFTIWFSYKLDENCDIPITYATLEDFTYFDFEKFKQRLKYNKVKMRNIKYGLDSYEIEIMNKLCKYLTDNKDIIKEIGNIVYKKNN